MIFDAIRVFPIYNWLSGDVDEIYVWFMYVMDVDTYNCNTCLGDGMAYGSLTLWIGA